MPGSRINAPRRRLYGVGAAVALLLAWTALSPLALAADHDIAITSGGYDPAEITVLTGEPVTWTNETGATHTVTSDDGELDSGPVGPGEAYGHVFETPGTYSYQSTTPGDEMTGTVIVKAAPPTTTPSGSPPPEPPEGTLPPNFSPFPTQGLPEPTIVPELTPAATPAQTANPTGSSDGGQALVMAGAVAVVLLGGALLVLLVRQRRGSPAS